MSSADGSNIVQGRYRDAYSVAASIVGWGNVLKILGIVAAVIIVLLGLGAAVDMGAKAVVGSIIFAAAVGWSFYSFGIMIAAQGQVLLAVLDTGVNTSPLLSVEQKTDIIVGRGTGVYTQPRAAAEAALDRTPMTKCPSCGANVYATAKMCGACWKPLPGPV